MEPEVPAFLRPMTDEEARAFKPITAEEIAAAIGDVDRAVKQARPLATMRPCCPCHRRYL